MYSSFIDAALPAVGVSLAVFILMVAIGIKIRRKWVFLAAGLALGVCVFPLTFAVIHHSYVQGKYCYRFSASDWNEYSLKVSDRKMSPYIPEHSHGINVWHTECYWWATYSCDDDSWKNFQGVCQEKFGLVEARDHPGLPPNEVYAGIEKYKGFKPDHVYQLPIAVNGAQFVCCRNDSTGFVVSWSNRW